MKTYYQIEGMHCKSCEILIERHLREISGVTDVRANYSTGVAQVSYDGKPPEKSRVSSAIHTAGYSLGTSGPRPFISRDSALWSEVFFSACIVFVLYLFSNIFGFFDFVARVGTASGPSTALLVGLTAGVSSCMALIGGLVLGISARYADAHPEATRAQKFRPHLFFNIGRFVSFGILGGVMGAIGAAVRPSGGLLGVLVIVAGIVMVMLGAKLLEVFPRLASGITLPSGIARMLGLDHQTREYSHRNAFTLGALTFFLPCGFTQAMQIYAVSTGSFVQGAIVMSLFALGTTPGLLGIGALASAVKGNGARIFFKVAGIIVLILGFWNISNGWNLTGIVLGQSPSGTAVQKPGATGTQAVQRDGKQYIAMNQWAGGYNPNRFVVKRGVPTVWTVTSTDSYTCASSLVAPALKIARSLTPGENIIEFTPTKVGRLKFSCSMGMYTGIIEVIN